MQTITRSTVVLMSGTGATAAFGLAYIVFAARVLGPDRYAVFSTAVSLVMMCQLALGPINETITRFSAAYASEGHPGKVKTLVLEIGKRVALFGLVFVGLATLLIKPIATFLRVDEFAPLLLAYVMLYLTMLVGLGRGVLRGVQWFGAYNVNTLADSISRFLIGLVLLGWSASVSAGLVAYVAALAVALSVSYLQLRHLWRGHARQELDGSAVRRFAIPIFATMAVYASFHNFDMLLVKHFFSATDAGIYGAAFNLARVMAIIMTPFSTLLVPLLTALHTQGRPIWGSFLRVATFFVLIALCVIALFGLFSPQIFKLFTPQYASGATLLLPLALVRLVGFLSFLIAMAGAAVHRFTFLYAFVPGLIVQIIFLAIWHDSLATVVNVTLAAQGATLVAMVFFAVGILRRSPDDAVGHSAR